jgi:hypothetical protein
MAPITNTLSVRVTKKDRHFHVDHIEQFHFLDSNFGAVLVAVEQPEPNFGLQPCQLGRMRRRGWARDRRPPGQSSFMTETPPRRRSTNTHNAHHCWIIGLARLDPSPMSLSLRG